MIVVFNEIQKCESYFRFVGFMTIQNNVVGWPMNYITNGIYFSISIFYRMSLPIFNNRINCFCTLILTIFRSFPFVSLVFELFFCFRIPTVNIFLLSDPAAIKKKDKLRTEILLKAKLKQTKWIVLYLKFK